MRQTFQALFLFPRDWEPELFRFTASERGVPILKKFTRWLGELASWEHAGHLHQSQWLRAAGDTEVVVSGALGIGET